MEFPTFRFCLSITKSGFGLAPFLLLAAAGAAELDSISLNEQGRARALEGRYAEAEVLAKNALQTAPPDDRAMLYAR